MKYLTFILSLFLLASCTSGNLAPSLCGNGGDLKCSGGQCMCSTSGNSTKQSADQNNR